MTKQIIIHGNVRKKSIQFLYWKLRNLYGSSEKTATVQTIPTGNGSISFRRNNLSDNLKACFIYYLDPEYFDPKFFNTITQKNENPFNDEKNNFQYFVAIPKKPVIYPNDLRRVNLFELPELHDKKYLSHLAKLIWIHLQLNALPNSIGLKDAQILKDYYESRLKNHREKLNRAHHNYLKNIEVKDAKVVA